MHGSALIRANDADISEVKIIVMDSATGIGFAEKQGMSERQEAITQIRSFNLFQPPPWARNLLAV
jgi:hypothetical protein